MPRMKDFYQKTVTPKLVREFSYKNPNQVPRLVKVSLNMGLGEAIQNAKILDAAAEELAAVKIGRASCRERG